jgi:RNA polymerase sigma factor (sigma-70 family)
MTTSSLGAALRCLCRFGPAGEVERLTDAQLLERFALAQSEVAFAELVRRHGPMVLGVCRRVLRHEQDAEDAFQAAFLVLARKAACVARPGLLGNWLYGVACRTAREARGLQARRRCRERQVESMPEPAVFEPSRSGDWQSALDEELSNLPERYRAAVVLCELDGRPRREVADLLGIPEGTLSSRLATARKKLAHRLARRGVALPAGALAAVLPPLATAAVPRALLVSTVKAATSSAAGAAAGVSAEVAALAKGVVQAMFAK